MKVLRCAPWVALGLACATAPLHGQAAPPPSSYSPPARHSWTADRRQFGEGDVVTVLIDDFTLAAANKGNFASDRRYRDLGLDAQQSVSAALPSVGAAVSSINDAESRQRGEATRQNRFQGEISVRVVGVEPNGMLQVEGRKLVNIDKATQEMVLRGFVRPQDISTGNVVESWRIADVELLYTGGGALGKPQGGILSRLLGALWP